VLHESLWQLNVDIAQQCRAHPFVRGLADGTLDRDTFRRYIAQDAYFLHAFFRAYSLAAAKCDDIEHARVFHQLMGGVLDELKLHVDYAADLDIDLDAIRPYPATAAYTSFLLRIAWSDSLAIILAAMVPCMRLYAFLGEQLLGCLRPEHRYHQWISTYSGDDFKSLCVQLESLLDEWATDCSAVRDAYRYAMHCELKFFSAPLE